MSNKYENSLGRVLRVDLTRSTVSVDKLSAAEMRQVLGGASLGAKLLYDEVPPGVEWNDPENRFIVASGPLGGTLIPGSGTFSVISKGPMTNGAGITQANGFFGSYLRHCGFDAVLVQGKAPKLSYIYIGDGTVEIRDASALAGKDTWETDDILHSAIKSRRPLSVLCIGPAGENGVRFAGVFADKGHSASHNGVGAVMGAKNLKAIAVTQGSAGVPVYDGKKLLDIVEQLSKEIRTGADGQGVDTYRWGTLNGVYRGVDSVTGTLPVKNYTTAHFKLEKNELQNYSAPYIRDAFTPSRSPCYACLMRHSHKLRVPDGPHKGKIVDEPEYEGLAACGPVIGQKDSTWAIVLSDLTDRLGIDVNETGWLVGLVMECYEKGILTKNDTGGLEMTWGNAEAAYELLHLVARREGLGNTLAEGTMRAAKLIGNGAEEMAVHTQKGNSPRGHDHRAVWSELFDTATSNTSTLETGGRLIVTDVARQLKLPGSDQFSPEGTAEGAAMAKGAMLFEDSLGTCRFTIRTELGLLTDMLEAITGIKLSREEALTVGRRTANRLRMFNIRHGISPELDRPSKRYGSKPADGPAADKSIMPHWDKMLQVYYEKMGWDANGHPLPKTLQSLGLEELIPASG